jgi:hypothetical protein
MANTLLYPMLQIKAVFRAYLLFGTCKTSDSSHVNSLSPAGKRSASPALLHKSAQHDY